MNSEPPGKVALTTAAEFMKYTIALGTGSLVFSAGLVSQDIGLPTYGKVLLILSWVSLVASVIAGVLAYSRIPIQLAEENYDLEDKWFTYPGRVHQGAFLLGIVCLGAALIVALS
jgi:hypothetical protein